jgi:general secretion pathway protein B
MSFILDALKKSELERQRQTVPGLMDTRVPARRSRAPLIVALLGVLLVFNIAVLAFVMMRSNSGTAAVVAKQPASPAPVAAQPAAEHFSPLSPAPVYAPEVPVTETATAVDAGPEIRTGPGGSISVAPVRSDSPHGDAPHGDAPHSDATRSPQRGDPLLNEPAAKDDNDEVLPTFSELNLTGDQALPEMHLDVHVYGTKAADRFVYINMRKYHEGNTLQEGPTLERIRRDGVVLSFHGLRFVLPRQS